MPVPFFRSFIVDQLEGRFSGYFQESSQSHEVGLGGGELETKIESVFLVGRAWDLPERQVCLWALSACE